MSSIPCMLDEWTSGGTFYWLETCPRPGETPSQLRARHDSDLADIQAIYPPD